ncbi:DUF2779 domain-containing protein [Chloroflexota bacterium]
MKPQLLSKSRYLLGLQCLKYLWTSFHEPEKIAEPDAATRYLFDQGHLVGELAKKLFPGGVDIPVDDFMGSIRQTRELLKQRRTVFEAAILTGNIYSRIDILSPANDNEWDIIEVKSATRVKDVDVDDVSFQRFCCQQAGLEIRKCFLAHINNEYVRQGEIVPDQLFITEDITERVEDVAGDIPDKVNTMLEVMAAERCPDVAIGSQCNHPYACPIIECRDFLPDYNVLELYRGGQKCFELLNDGVLSIKDIPDTFRLTGSQQIQRMCVLSQQPHTDRALIDSFLNTLKYPLYYLDFETFSTAIPLFNGTRPYRNIPFQFSLHVVVGRESEPEHFSFLAAGKEDPRPEFLSALKKLLGDSGSIVVYNQSFEKGVLKNLGEAFPEYSGWVQGIFGRLVDLLTPFRNFWYYHPGQRGRASLKAVLPALTGKGYRGLNINSGEDASLAFKRVTYGDVSEEEKSRVRKDLEEYCALDTAGMVWIVEVLRETA